MMGIKEIQEIIPHRHPFLLIDCIEEVVPGESAVGYKSVTYKDYIEVFCKEKRTSTEEKFFG